MKRTCAMGPRSVAALATVAMVMMAGPVSSAAASGPAPPGKEVVPLSCEGIGSVTVSIPRPEGSNGAGQIVGMRGHGIPVSITFSVTDLTTGNTLFSETTIAGKGRAHPNQTTTTCTSTLFEGTASEIFGEELPEGVEETDEVRGTLEIKVIAKT